MAKDHLLCQPEEKKPQIAKASLQKGGGKGGLTRALNLRRRTNHILLLLLHSLWRRRTHKQHTIQQIKKFNCKNFTRTLKGVQCEVHIWFDPSNSKKLPSLRKERGSTCTKRSKTHKCSIRLHDRNKQPNKACKPLSEHFNLVSMMTIAFAENFMLKQRKLTPHKLCCSLNEKIAGTLLHSCITDIAEETSTRPVFRWSNHHPCQQISIATLHCMQAQLTIFERDPSFKANFSCHHLSESSSTSTGGSQIS